MNNPIINSNGTKYWYKNGKRHRENDLPAIELKNGDKYWFKNDKRHRENDLPAIEYSNGTKYWYKNGERHRDNDKPAIELKNGNKFWHKNGKLLKVEIEGVKIDYCKNCKDFCFLNKLEECKYYLEVVLDNE